MLSWDSLMKTTCRIQSTVMTYSSGVAARRLRTSSGVPAVL